MPTLSETRCYYIYSNNTDMRKGFNSLSGIVSLQMQFNPLSNDVYIFLNRRRTQMKLLHWEGDGFALFYKRLQKGTFQLPWGGQPADATSAITALGDICRVIQTAIDYKLLCEQKDEQIARLTCDLAAVTLELDKLKRMIFGSRHERFVAAETPSQISLNIQAEAIADRIVTTEQVEITRTSTTVTPGKKEHPGRPKLPEHLKRRETIVEPTV